MSLQYEVTKRYTHESVVYESASEVADYISSDSDYISEFEVDADDSIDANYGSIEIGGERYYASQIIRALNEDSYFDMVQREREFAAESDRDWVEERIEQMKNGDSADFFGGIIVVCSDTDCVSDRFKAEDFDSVFNMVTVVGVEPCEEKEQGV